VAGLLVFWVTRPEPSGAATFGTALSAGVTTTTTTPTTGRGASATGSSAPASAPTLEAIPADPPTSRATPPTQLAIAAVGLRMPIVPVGVAADGEMALPPSPATAGWYRYAAHPGDPEGATVIAGHLDEPWYGTGPLGRLRDVSPGDTVVVRAGSSSRRYVVVDVQAVPKARLDLATIFRVDGPPSLHIVTCGGRFDPTLRRYDENVVVIARPA
jgi:hypothetical protein